MRAAIRPSFTTLANLPVFDVHSPAYGAVGDGTTDDRAAIELAIAAADAAGGGIVQLKGKTYLLGMVGIPGDLTWGHSILMRGTVWLRGAGQYSTTLKLSVISSGSGAGQYGSFSTGASFVSNASRGAASGENGWKISDLTIDGQGSSQGFNFQGIKPWGCNDVVIENVRVKNCRGTASSGSNETFWFDAQRCTNVVFRNCIAEGGHANSASGFSSNYSNQVTWDGCLAYDFRIGMGFTCYQSTHMIYTQCRAYDITANAFNAEYCSHVHYANCQAGLDMPQSTGESSVYNSTAAAVEETVAKGWVVLGCGNVQIDAPKIVAVSTTALDLNGTLGGGTGQPTVFGPIVIRDAYIQAAAGGATQVVNFNGDAHKATYFRGVPYVTGTFTTNGYNGSSNFTGSSGPGGSNSGATSMKPGILYSASDTTARTPPVPLTNTPFTNDWPFDVDVEVVGATVTALYVSHTGTVQTSKDARAFNTAGTTVRVPKGQAIQLTYASGSPTWKWFAVYN